MEKTDKIPVFPQGTYNPVDICFNNVIICLYILFITMIQKMDDQFPDHVDSYCIDRHAGSFGVTLLRTGRK